MFRRISMSVAGVMILAIGGCGGERADLLADFDAELASLEDSHQVHREAVVGAGSLEAIHDHEQDYAMEGQGHHDSLEHLTGAMDGCLHEEQMPHMRGMHSQLDWLEGELDAHHRAMAEAAGHAEAIAEEDRHHEVMAEHFGDMHRHHEAMVDSGWHGCHEHHGDDRHHR